MSKIAVFENKYLISYPNKIKTTKPYPEKKTNPFRKKHKNMSDYHYLNLYFTPYSSSNSFRKLINFGVAPNVLST